MIARIGRERAARGDRAKGFVSASRFRANFASRSCASAWVVIRQSVSFSGMALSSLFAPAFRFVCRIYRWDHSRGRRGRIHDMNYAIRQGWRVAIRTPPVRTCPYAVVAGIGSGQSVLDGESGGGGARGETPSLP